jgi:hypothetical protein
MGRKAKGSTTYLEREGKIWQKWKTIMRMKPSAFDFAEGVRVIPVSKERHYSVLEGKAFPQNRNQAAIAAPVMSGTNTI